MSCARPTATSSLLFTVDIGTFGTLSAQQHCCEVCERLRGCTASRLHEGVLLRGALASCGLYGALPPAPPPQPKSDAILLLRSDAQKLATLTRCHREYVTFVRSRLSPIGASMELLVDATALSNRTTAAAIQSQLASTLGVGAFAYTVEQLWAAFPAVKHWPSPEDHDSSHNKLKGGDVVRIWWAKVLKKYKRALGPDVARRLTSYLIHEPSLVLWARGRAAAGLSLPAHVWVIEDDAVFLGGLGEFVRGLHGSPADLISTFGNLAGKQIEAASHDWKANGAFIRKYANRRVHKWEHVERFSSRLITHLDALLSKDGAAAHGEMFASTVCFAESWCKAEDLRLIGVVDMNSALYGPSKSVLVTSDRWERRDMYDRHRANGAPGVWLHAVKDYCNALSLASNESVRVGLDDPSQPFVLAELGVAGGIRPTVPSAECSATAAGPLSDEEDDEEVDDFACGEDPSPCVGRSTG